MRLRLTLLAALAVLCSPAFAAQQTIDTANPTQNLATGFTVVNDNFTELYEHDAVVDNGDNTCTFTPPDGLTPVTFNCSAPGGGIADTDALPEGLVNLYYTEARVAANAAVAANTAAVAAELVEDAAQDALIATNTADIATNTAGLAAEIASTDSEQTAQDTSIAANTADIATNTAGLAAEIASTDAEQTTQDAAIALNTAKVVPGDTDALAEGATNLYHTEARVLATDVGTPAGTTISDNATVFEALEELEAAAETAAAGVPSWTPAATYVPGDEFTSLDPTTSLVNLYQVPVGYTGNSGPVFDVVEEARYTELGGAPGTAHSVFYSDAAAALAGPDVEFQQKVVLATGEVYHNICATAQDFVVPGACFVETTASGSALAPVRVDASAAAQNVVLTAATGSEDSILYALVDKTNAADITVQAGESLNGVVDATFDFAAYDVGTQFLATDRATGLWDIAVIGEPTEQGGFVRFRFHNGMQQGVNSYLRSQTNSTDVEVEAGKHGVTFNSGTVTNAFQVPAGLWKITLETELATATNNFSVALSQFRFGSGFSTTDPGATLIRNIEADSSTVSGSTRWHRRVLYMDITSPIEGNFYYTGTNGGDTGNMFVEFERIDVVQSAVAGAVPVEDIRVVEYAKQTGLGFLVNYNLDGGRTWNDLIADYEFIELRYEIDVTGVTEDVLRTIKLATADLRDDTRARFEYGSAIVDFEPGALTGGDFQFTGATVDEIAATIVGVKAQKTVIPTDEATVTDWTPYTATIDAAGDTATPFIGVHNGGGGAINECYYREFAKELHVSCVLVGGTDAADTSTTDRYVFSLPPGYTVEADVAVWARSGFQSSALGMRPVGTGVATDVAATNAQGHGPCFIHDSGEAGGAADGIICMSDDDGGEIGFWDSGFYDVADNVTYAFDLRIPLQ